MRQLNNTQGNFEIVLTTVMLMIGGSLLQAQAPHDTSYTASFPCTGYDQCPSSGVVSLEFIPKPGSHTERWQMLMTATNPSGKIVGTLKSADRFAPLDLAPGEIAGLWVGQIGPDAVRDRGFGIYKLDSDGHRVGQPWWKKTADQIIYCEPRSPTPNPGGRTNAAIHMKNIATEMGWNCGPLVPMAQSTSNYRGGAKYQNTMLVTDARRSQGISHLWISCSGGCCDIGAM